MPKPTSKMWSFFFACLNCLDIWLEEAGQNYRDPVTFATFVEWVSVKTEALRENAPSSLKALIRLLVTGSDPDLYNASAVKLKLNTKSNGRMFRVVVAAMPRPDENRRPTPVRRMLTSLVDDPEILCPFSSFISPFFTDTGCTRSKGRVVVDNFSTSVATRFEQVIYVSSIIMATYAIDSRRRKRYRRNDGTFTIAPTLHLEKLTDRTSHRIGWNVQRVVSAWDQLASSIGISGAEEMVRAFVILRRPWARFEVLKGVDDGFVRKNESRLYTLDASTTQDSAESFDLVKGLPPPVVAALRQFAHDFLQDLEIAVLSSELYTMAAKDDWEWNKRLTRRALGLPLRFQNYREEERRSVAAHFGAHLTFVESIEAGSDSDVLPPLHGPAPAPVQTSVPATLLESSMTLLEHSSKPYFRLYSCESNALVSANNLDVSAPVLDGSVQLVLTDPPYNVRRNRQAKHSTYDELSLSAMRETVEVVAEMLRPGGHAVLFCTAQQFPIWQNLFQAVSSESEGPPSRMFMVDNAPMTFVDHPSFHRNNPARKSCALASAVDFALHVKKNGKYFAEEEKMVNYKQFGFVSSSFPGYKNVISDVKGPERGERLMVPSSGTETARRLRPEQKPTSLLRELVSRFSQPSDIVVDLFAGTFSTAVACFTVPEHRVFIGCEPDPACFALAKSAVLKQFAKAALNPSTNIVLSAEANQAAAVVDSSMPEMPSADPLWSPPDGLPLHQCLSPGVMHFLGSLWHDAEFVQSHMKLPVHCWHQQYLARLREVDVDILRVADACACSVTIAPSKIRHPSAGLGVFASRTFQKDDIIGAYYGTLVYHDLSSRQHTRKVYGDGVLKVDVARFSKYALQLRVQGKRFEGVKERICGAKAVCIVPASFCACAFINDFHYAEKDQDYEKYRNGQLLDCRSPNVRFVQTNVATDAHLVDPFCVKLQAIRKISPLDEMYVDYCKSDFATSVQLDFV